MIPFAVFMPQASSAPYVTSSSYATAESLAEQSTTGGSLSGASITFNPAANTDYLFFWSHDIQTSATTTTSYAQALVNGADAFSTDPTVQPASVSPLEYYSMGGMFRVQGGSSPVATTVSVSGNQGGTGTLKLRNSRLSYIKIGSNDVYSESLARQTFATPANKTAASAASFSFTPPTSGDYIILCSFNYDLANQTNVDFTATLSDGTTSTGGAWWRPHQSGDRCPGMLVLFLSAASGAKTITLKVQQPNSGGTTIGIGDIRMIALRADRFADVHHTQLGSNNTGTNSTYSTAFSQTFTPNAADYLTLASWAEASSTAVTVYGQYVDGAVTVNEFIRDMAEAAGNGLAGFAHRIATYPASSLTQAVQRHGNGSVSNLIQSPSTILTIELTGI